MHQVHIEQTGIVIAARVAQAHGLWSRTRGLMFRRQLEPGSGIDIRPCSSIHMMFMRFPIDLIYFDKENRVTKIKPAVKPWRVDLTSAAGVIEMNPGSAEAAGLRPGDVLEFRSA